MLLCPCSLWSIYVLQLPTVIMREKPKKTFNPGLKKTQILHFSGGVTLRLYSGNRV